MKISEIDKSLPIEIYNKDRFGDEWVQINLVEYDQEDVVYYYQGKLHFDSLDKVDFRNKQPTFNTRQVVSELWEGWLRNYPHKDSFEYTLSWLEKRNLLKDVEFIKDEFGSFVKIDKEEK